MKGRIVRESLRPGVRVLRCCAQIWTSGAAADGLAAGARPDDDEAGEFVPIEISDAAARKEPEASIEISVGKSFYGCRATRAHCASPRSWLRSSDSRDRSTQGLRIVLAVRSVDFRCGRDALAGLMQNTLGLDPHSGLIVVFRTKRMDRLKILLGDGTGLVLVYKRLGEGHFVWPQISEGVLHLTRA